MINLLTCILLSGFLLTTNESLNRKLNTGSYAEVTTKALRAMIDAEIPMIIIDTRREVKQGDVQIPHSIHLRPNATPQEVQAALPSKKALIITYCENLKCPDEADLAVYLSSLGYKNVIEYSVGLKDWIAHRYPVEIVK